jgi:hypothetical protein
VLVECGDATNGESVAPVNVGHGNRWANDAGEMRNVHDLLNALVSFEIVHQLVVGKDEPISAHATRPLHPPAVRVDTVDFDWRHGMHSSDGGNIPGEGAWRSAGD